MGINNGGSGQLRNGSIGKEEYIALDKMIRMAHDDTRSHVRGQALFSLAQSNDPRALQFFEKVLAQ